MTTMLEKAAQAALEAMPAYSPTWEENGIDEPRPWVARYVDTGEVDFTVIIRAALLAIREPDMPTVIAGRKRLFDDMTGPHMGPSAEWTFTAMIDAILNEKPEAGTT